MQAQYADSGVYYGSVGSQSNQFYEPRKPVGTSTFNALAIFPTAFTLTCGLAFLCPSYDIFWLSHTPAVAYWDSGWANILFIVPLIIFVVHIIHVRTEAPNKPAVVFALLVPSILLLGLGNNQYGMAVSRATKLFSTDCDTFAEKANLQRSWEAAYMLFENCLNQTSAASGYPMQKLRDNFRVQDCEEYGAGMKQYGKDWNYLRYLEENHHCAGWCYPGVQLWSSSLAKDDCSTFVSAIFRNFVMPHCSQVVIMMVLTLLAATVGLIVLGPILRSRGVAW